MAGITKALGNFTHNTFQSFVVNSSLSDIFISNQGTEDINVILNLSLDGYDQANPLAAVVIPPTVTLNIFENEPLKLSNVGAGAKARIKYTCTSQSNGLMTVVYTSR